MDDDAKQLARVLRREFGRRKGRPFLGWPDPSMNVLDCVLSLNRRYDQFVLPRLQAFAEVHPSYLGVRGLRRLIRSYDSPRAFSVSELRYNDPSRADVLLGVTEYLCRQLTKLRVGSESARLRAWARRVGPTDLDKVGVFGFGLAGFQYLRMLFGAQTVKPDRHIVRFVAVAIGRRVSMLEALELLERASRIVRIRIRDLDYAIWEAAARRGGTSYVVGSPVSTSAADRRRLR